MDYELKTVTGFPQKRSAPENKARSLNPISSQQDSSAPSTRKVSSRSPKAALMWISNPNSTREGTSDTRWDRPQPGPECRVQAKCRHAGSKSLPPLTAGTSASSTDRDQAVTRLLSWNIFPPLSFFFFFFLNVAAFSYTFIIQGLFSRTDIAPPTKLYKCPFPLEVLHNMAGPRATSAPEQHSSGPKLYSDRAISTAPKAPGEPS